MTCFSPHVTVQYILAYLNLKLQGLPTSKPSVVEHRMPYNLNHQLQEHPSSCRSMMQFDSAASNSKFSHLDWFFSASMYLANLNQSIYAAHMHLANLNVFTQFIQPFPSKIVYFIMIASLHLTSLHLKLNFTSLHLSLRNETSLNAKVNQIIHSSQYSHTLSRFRHAHNLNPLLSEHALLLSSALQWGQKSPNVRIAGAFKFQKGETYVCQSVAVWMPSGWKWEGATSGNGMVIWCGCWYWWWWYWYWWFGGCIFWWWSWWYYASAPW